MSERIGYNMQEELHRLKSETDDGAITSVHAHHIVENAVINAVNEGLEPEQQIISSDGVVSLKWLVDEEAPEGHFAIIQRLERKAPVKKSKPDEFVSEGIDEKTKKEIWVKKMSGPSTPLEDTATFLYLDTNQVKEILNELEPAVKKSFVDGESEALEASIKLVEERKDMLKNETDEGKITKLKKDIEEEELAQERIKKMLKAIK